MTTSTRPDLNTDILDDGVRGDALEVAAYLDPRKPGNEPDTSSLSTAVLCAGVLAALVLRLRRGPLVALTHDEVRGLRHWHKVSADYGDVEHATGVDLTALIYRLAALVTPAPAMPDHLDADEHADLMCEDTLREPGTDECGAEGPPAPPALTPLAHNTTHLHCTRPRNHDGPHVAHVEDEAVAMWVPVEVKPGFAGGFTRARAPKGGAR